MKSILLFLVFALILSGCGSSTPSQITDNGQPGQIKVIVFEDPNHNGVRDAGEAGIQDQVYISQDLSCPPTHKDKMIKKDTDPNGVALYQNLKPGHYCLGYLGNKSATTKGTPEVDLNSGQTEQVAFGVTE